MIDPVAFEIFGLSIHWYGIYYAVAFIGLYLFVSYFSKEFGVKKDLIQDFFPYFIIASVVGGRIFYVLFYNLQYYLSNPISIFAVWEGGMSIHGGFAGGFLALWYFARKNHLNVLKATDLFSVPVALGLAFGRILNFINQELVGKITTSSIGVIFPIYDDQKRWPVVLFDGFKSLILFQILLFYQFFLKFKTGMLTALFLIIYNFGRFFIDFLREPTVDLGLISMGQLLCLIFGFIGVWLYMKIK